MPNANLVASTSSALEEDASLQNCATQLQQLEQQLGQLEQSMRESIESVPVDHRESAKNLVHYMTLRQHDLRKLQERLALLGLSSLGRSESCVLGALLEVSTRVHESLVQRGYEDARAELSRLREARKSALSWTEARGYLHRHTRDIFGPRPADRHIYVMVTAPSAKEADRAWMVRLLRAGMNVLRINCAHEGEKEWEEVVQALAQARQETGLSCRLIMDLAGPKIRTGAITYDRRARQGMVADQRAAGEHPQERQTEPQIFPHAAWREPLEFGAELVKQLDPAPVATCALEQWQESSVVVGSRKYRRVKLRSSCMVTCVSGSRPVALDEIRGLVRRLAAAAGGTQAWRY